MDRLLMGSIRVLGYREWGRKRKSVARFQAFQARKYYYIFDMVEKSVRQVITLKEKMQLGSLL